MPKTETHVPSSGVDALIERLRNDGVVAGQIEAENIIHDAHKRAEWIISEAQSNAQQIVDKAKADASEIDHATQDALKLATRDAMLKLRDMLLGTFSEEVGRVVSAQMADREFMAKLILALAGRVRDKTGLDDSKNILLQLPEKITGIEALKKNPEELKEGTLSHLTAAISADLLRNGVTLGVASDLSDGLFIKLIDEEMMIDFSDKTVAALLLEHIQPRFRALLQGIVR
jgi:V/A-type H+/Na+-transporting ATPase subunit E